MSGRRNHRKHPAKPPRKKRRPARSGCGKVGYRDKAEALEWMHRLIGSKIRHQSTDRLEERVYECNVCRAKGAGVVWHTTSQAMRTGP